MKEQVLASEIGGRRIELSDGRFVFVGVHPKYPDDTGIVLRNAAGETTSFRLSPAARVALTALLTEPNAGAVGSPPPPSLQTWQLIFTAVLALSDKQDT